MTKKPRQTFIDLENENSFQSEIKNIFHHFQRASSFQKLSQTWKYAFNTIHRTDSLTQVIQLILLNISKPFDGQFQLHETVKPFWDKSYSISIYIIIILDVLWVQQPSTTWSCLRELNIFVCLFPFFVVFVHFLERLSFDIFCVYF